MLNIHPFLSTFLQKALLQPCMLNALWSKTGNLAAILKNFFEYQLKKLIIKTLKNKKHLISIVFKNSIKSELILKDNKVYHNKKSYLYSWETKKLY